MAVILDSITVGEFCIIEIDTDPRLGSGTSAAFGSIAVVQPENTSERPIVFQKIGTGDQDWVEYSPTTKNILKPSHGFSLTNNIPLPAYFDPSTGLTLAQANDFDTLKAFFITKVIDSNNVEIKQSGIHNAPKHGLNVGEYYFLSPSNAGELISVDPITEISEVCVHVLDTNTLLLIDNRPQDRESLEKFLFKASNTDTSTNINQVSPGVEVPLAGNVQINENSYYTPITNGVQVNSDRTYKVIVNAHVGGAATRGSLRLRIAINGVPQGAIAATGYIRNSNGHDESSYHLTDVFTLSAGDEITVVSERQSTVISTMSLETVGTSNIIVEAR